MKYTVYSNENTSREVFHKEVKVARQSKYSEIEIPVLSTIFSPDRQKGGMFFTIYKQTEGKRKPQREE